MKTSGRMMNNDRYGIYGGKQRNFDGTHTDKRCKLQYTTRRNWFYGGDVSGGRSAFGTGSGNSFRQLFLRRRFVDVFCIHVMQTAFFLRPVFIVWDEQSYLIITCEKKEDSWKTICEKKDFNIPRSNFRCNFAYVRWRGEREDWYE